MSALRKHQLAGLLLSGALTLGPLAAGLAQERPAKSAGKPREHRAATPGASVLAEDKAKFRIFVDGQPVGSEEFQISPRGNRWVAHGRVEVSVPGGAAEQYIATLELASDGSPVHYEWSAQGEKKRSATVDFHDGAAKMSLQMGGSQPFVQEFTFSSPRVAILDNNIYHHYAILARLYDWKTKGPQIFAVLIPQDQFPGTVTVEAVATEEMSGAKLEHLKVRSTDLEIDLYLDGAGRLMHLAVPASKAEVRREP